MITNGHKKNDLTNQLEKSRNKTIFDLFFLNFVFSIIYLQKTIIQSNYIQN